MTKKIMFYALFSLFLLLIPFFIFSAPKAEPWDRWKKNDPSSNIIVDHSIYGKFLDTYLIMAGSETNDTSMINKVNYAGVSRADKKSLETYISTMASIRVSGLHKEEQMAYWINLYNALTIHLILDHYPVDSIRNIKFSITSFGPWDEKLITIEGIQVSLNDIEHRILRPLWKDPRIHFAVNCASIGCPDIQAIPFTRENLETLLDKGAYDYINHERGVMVNAGRLNISSIFDWYYVDFAKTKKKVISFLIIYADEELKEILTNYKGTITYSYDWSLNEIIPSGS